MSEKVMTSESELYNQIVEMLSNGNFLQLNGKAINLTELNEYINAQQEENERLKEETKRQEKAQVILDNQNAELKERIDKALEIYENRNIIRFKKQRFMGDKDTGDLMYDVLKGEK